MSSKSSCCAIILFVIFLYWIPSGASLTIGGPKCGEKQCRPYEYCTFDRFCKPCADICNKSSHNYEGAECTKDCQDYLHDLRYGSDGDLRAMVEKLHSMVVVTLTLVIFVLVIIGVTICLKVFQWKKKKNITLSTLRSKLFGKQSDSVSTKPPAATTMNQNGKSDLRLEISTPGNQSDHSPVTATTSISRRPAEDSALDYAYDNPAMASTPPSVKPHESTF